MIKFILNFILFGILFFLIWHFFPEAFERMVGWLTSLFNWVINLVNGLISPDKLPPPPAHS